MVEPNLDIVPIEDDMNKYFLHNINELLKNKGKKYKIRLLVQDNPNQVDTVDITEYNNFNLIKKTLKLNCENQSFSDINKIHAKINFLGKQYKIDNDKKNRLTNLIGEISKKLQDLNKSDNSEKNKERNEKINYYIKKTSEVINGSDSFSSMISNLFNEYNLTYKYSEIKNILQNRNLIDRNIKKLYDSLADKSIMAGDYIVLFDNSDNSDKDDFIEKYSLLYIVDIHYESIEDTDGKKVGAYYILKTIKQTENSTNYYFFKVLKTDSTKIIKLDKKKLPILSNYRIL